MIDLYLVRNTLRDLTRPRKLLAALLLVVSPALLILLIGSLGGHPHLKQAADYDVISVRLIYGFVLVILSVVFCTGVVAQEVEDKTIVYLLTRPVARFRILLVKFVPALLVTLVTVWLALLLAAVAALGPSGLRGSHLGRDLAIAPIGVLAYGSVFVLLSTLVSRPVIFGLLYAFGWESWVPIMPGNFRLLSIMSYLHVLTPHSDDTPEEVDLTQALTNSVQTTITNHRAWAVLIGVIVVSTLLSLLVFTVKEYVPRDAE